MSVILKINSDARPIEDWRVSKARINRRNAAADTLELSFADTHCAQDIAAGDSIEILKNGVRKFYGRVLKLPQKTSGVKKNLELLARNPWGDLEDTVYQQLWKIHGTQNGLAALTSVRRSKVVLGQDSEGQKIGTSAQLYDILNYAVLCGAEFQIGTIDAVSDMLLDEAKDLSCAEAIGRVLKWLPGANAWFDYSAEGYPILNIVSRDKLENVDICATRGDIKNFSVSARPDLEISGVCIKYESENTENGYSWISLSEDVYPENFDPNSRRALVMSVELNGYKSSAQAYDAICETIQASSPQWWRNHIDEIHDNDTVQIEQWSRDNPEGVSYVRELVAGSLPDGNGINCAKDIVRGRLSYADFSEALEGGGYATITKDFALRLVTTNVASGRYLVWSTSQSAETPPSGLAQAIYEYASEMQFEGNISIIGGDASEFAGKKISISGDKIDWLEMQAPVVSSSEDLFSEILTLNFGHPNHLYPDNIAELFRINRTRHTAISAVGRSSGKTSANTVEMTSRDANSTSQETGTSKLVVQNVNGGKTININAKDLAQNDTAQFREVAICYNGRGARAKFLMTAPVYDESLS